MKNHILSILALMILLSLALAAATLAQAEPPEEVEWTVLFYLCGSDLESRHGYATGNLEEIVTTDPYSSYLPIFGDYAENLRTDEELAQMRVNVVLETGGSKEWHAEPLGMDVDPTALQRWHYQPMERRSYDGSNTFQLDETLPLKSMSDPETLSDFIHWAAENYPARKYALVMWDHGGGSMTGICIDELFDGDIMLLDELHQAFADGGVTFEAVLFDACLMANIETAYAIKDNAKWMIASEEVVAGKGTAMGNWLQQLYFTPQWDGEWLGRWICDMTQIKYSNEADEQSQSLLTWSVIDLSKIERVVDLTDQLFALCNEAYKNDAYRLSSLAYHLRNAEEFGSGMNNMFDLSDVFYDEMAVHSIGFDLYSDMLDALMGAVVYSVRGAGRSGARGLSFCYTADLYPDEMDVYARNCPMPHYLAFMDAILTTWTAPDWVYEKVERLPDISDMPEYDIVIEKTFTEDGMPGVRTVEGSTNVQSIYADLYWHDERASENIRYGSTVTSVLIDLETLEAVSCVKDPAHWLSVDGVFCDAELVTFDLDDQLYNIPVQIGTENWLLRCAYDGKSDSYEIYGIWEGYDADTSVFNRNVKSLSQMAGQEFVFLYPVEWTDFEQDIMFRNSEPMTMYRSMEIEKTAMPTGTIYMDYWVKDMFLRPLYVGRVALDWDGQTLKLVEGESWDGEIRLNMGE